MSEEKAVEKEGNTLASSASSQSAASAAVATNKWAKFANEDDATKTIEALLRENNDLKKQLNEAQEFQGRVFKRLDDTIASLSSNKQEVRANVDSEVERKKALKSENKNLRNENKDLKKALDVAEAERKALRDFLRKQVTEIEQFKNETFDVAK